VILKEGRWVLATDDVKQAFDHVNIDDLMADHRRHLRSGRLLALVEAVLRGCEGRRVGIDQGSAYSPTALNVRLHHAHDLGFDPGHLAHDPGQQGHRPSRPYRYADNVVYACRDASEGLEALDRANRLLGQAGLSLKGKDGPPVDLRQGQAQMLGFCLTAEGGRLVYALGQDAWAGLELALGEAHQAENPPATARKVVKGWVTAYGPAFESWRESDTARLYRTAAGLGFRETCSPEELTDWREATWKNWLVRKQAGRGLQGP
jgi:hypothetical protein